MVYQGLFEALSALAVRLTPALSSSPFPFSIKLLWNRITDRNNHQILTEEKIA